MWFDLRREHGKSEDPLGRERDGRIALRPHPETGHLGLVFGSQGVLTLNGNPLDYCFFADDERGVAYETEDPEHGNWNIVRREGRIEFHWDPITCYCFGECEGAAPEICQQRREEHQAYLPSHRTYIEPEIAQ